MHATRSSLALSWLLLLLVGCLPPIEGAALDDDEPLVDDPPGVPARQRFDRDVFPLLDKKCADAAGCHRESELANGPFVDDVAAEGYDRAVTQPRLVGGFTTQAPLLTKIAAGHKNVTYSPNDLERLSRWLAKEVDERGVTRDLIAEWSGCMNLTDFVDTGMAPAWSYAPTPDGYCVACHALGEYQYAATDQPGRFFQVITTNRSYLTKYFTLDPTNSRVTINHDNMRLVGLALDPHYTHPRFDVSPESPHMVVLQDFYDRTVARAAAQQCEPPRL